MGEKFHVVPDELRGYAGLLERNAQHFTAIRGHAVSRGGDTAGFTGLLTLLHPVVTGVAELYAETLDFANQQMVKDAAALTTAADRYAQMDAARATAVSRTGRAAADLKIGGE
ncbi:hypothetical protein [Umezawaea beigongshangensis]|uniref:hypothetical protein n=1 Tax=Umezawaea beigongshangensis TaxID=2780383 RepID=UPI0018F20C26|nr:hypothetical protein [Umezawaea beigongshangensis]